MERPQKKTVELLKTLFTDTRYTSVHQGLRQISRHIAFAVASGKTYVEVAEQCFQNTHPVYIRRIKDTIVSIRILMLRADREYDLHEKIKKDISSGDVTNLSELTPRTSNGLMARGINTCQMLTSMSESDLLRIPNLGRKSLKEIKSFLATKGLSLKI